VQLFSLVRFGDATASPGYLSPIAPGASWKNRLTATSRDELEYLYRAIGYMVRKDVCEVWEKIG
jgi:hypothetical protein